MDKEETPFEDQDHTSKNQEINKSLESTKPHIDLIETPHNVFLKQKITQLSVPLLDTISKEYIDNFKFFHEKHYEDYYFADCNKQGQHDDMNIRVHTNKLLLLYLAEGNDIMQTNKTITEIDFIINKGDRSKVKLRGKRKLGARQLHPETIVCKVKLDGEEEMRNVRAGVTGYLIEINEVIKTNPNALKTQLKGNGFLAIVMPKGPLNKIDLILTNPQLIQKEAYLELLKGRNT